MDPIFSTYFEIVQGAYEAGQLSRTYYENLIDRFTEDLDELEENFKELLQAINHSEYYITLDRIAKGEEKLSIETDEAKKTEYRKLLNELTIKLENLMPRGESA